VERISKGPVGESLKARRVVWFRHYWVTVSMYGFSERFRRWPRQPKESTGQQHAGAHSREVVCCTSTVAQAGASSARSFPRLHLLQKGAHVRPGNTVEPADYSYIDSYSFRHLDYAALPRSVRRPLTARRVLSKHLFYPDRLPL
jgi:hypothetical protein